MSYYSYDYPRNTGDLWPCVTAYRILFKTRDGGQRLTAVIQGPGMTAEQAKKHTTQYVRDNLIEIHKCQPLP